MHFTELRSYLEAGETKNEEGRTVYLDAELQEIFQRREDARRERTKITPYVFVNEAGKNTHSPAGHDSDGPDNIATELNKPAIAPPPLSSMLSAS